MKLPYEMQLLYIHLINQTKVSIIKDQLVIEYKKGYAQLRSIFELNPIRLMSNGILATTHKLPRYKIGSAR